jgi:hypothetical protein
MPVADRLRHRPPSGEVGHVIGFRAARILHPGFQEPDFMLGIQAVPIATKRLRIRTGGLGAAYGPLAEMCSHVLRHIREPRHPIPRVQGDVGTVAPQIIGKVGLIERAPFMHAAVEPGKVEAADATARRLHHMEHCNMGVHLHVAGHAPACAGQAVQLRCLAPILIPGDNRHSRPGRVVIERNPADRAGLIPVFAALVLARPPDLRLDDPHDALDRVAVRLVQNGALGIGRREGPGDRQRFRRGKRQVDIADARF